MIELLMASVVLVAALLAIANMMPTSHTNITDAGKRTMALTAARQILEDMRSVPFNNLTVLDGFDTSNQATLPASDTNPTEHDLARRWRYTLAGEGDGFTFTPDEKTRWATLSRGLSANPLELDGRAQVSVAPLDPLTCGGCQLTDVTVTITFPGRGQNLVVATRITRLS